VVIKEIFPNPTVKQVVFGVTFPNLFYIENKIGEFQMKIMNEFPHSELVYRRNILFADIGPKDDIKPMSEERGSKIWEFKSPDKNSTLGITTNNLSIVSKHYKTYNLDGGEKFRDIINSIVTKFNDVMNLSTFSKIGLRYIDECPVPAMDNEKFKEYYNSTFDLERFPLKDCTETFSRTVTKRGKHNLIYMEALQKNKEKDNFIFYMDFDSFASNVPANNFLTVTDELHNIISTEYERTIREPVYEYMKKKV